MVENMHFDGEINVSKNQNLVAHSCQWHYLQDD